MVRLIEWIMISLPSEPGSGELKFVAGCFHKPKGSLLSGILLAKSLCSLLVFSLLIPTDVLLSSTWRQACICSIHSYGLLDKLGQEEGHSFLEQCTGFCPSASRGVLIEWITDSPPAAGMPFSFDCQRVSLLLNDVNLTYGASFIFVQNLQCGPGWKRSIKWKG